MQEMHPDIDEEQLEEMYELHHGEDGGMMQGMTQGNFEGMKNMMNSQR